MADKPELTAGDVIPGTGFEVVTREDGTFEVTVYYDWKRRNDGVRAGYYDGRGTGATFTEAAGMAIADAEGELEEDTES